MFFKTTRHSFEQRARTPVSRIGERFCYHIQKMILWFPADQVWFDALRKFTDELNDSSDDNALPKYLSSLTHGIRFYSWIYFHYQVHNRIQMNRHIFDVWKRRLTVFKRLQECYVNSALFARDIPRRSYMEQIYKYLEACCFIRTASVFKWRISF